MHKVHLPCLALGSLLVACGQPVESVATATGTPAAGAVVAELPLQRGFYVSADTPCGEASNATLMLLQRDGIGGARDFCEFTAIEQTGPTSFRITETCGALFDESVPVESEVVDYSLSGDTAFSTTSSTGWQREARYCEQSSLPEDWRDNDISDLIR